MADLPVSSLSTLVYDDLDGLDQLYIRDVSEGVASAQNKKVLISDLAKNGNRVTSDKLLIVDNSSTPISTPDTQP